MVEWEGEIMRWSGAEQRPGIRHTDDWKETPLEADKVWVGAVTDRGQRIMAAWEK